MGPLMGGDINIPDFLQIIEVFLVYEVPNKVFKVTIVCTSLLQVKTVCVNQIIIYILKNEKYQ